MAHSWQQMVCGSVGRSILARPCPDGDSFERGHLGRCPASTSLGRPPLAPGCRAPSIPLFAPCLQLPSQGGRLILASDGVWDAVSNERAAKCCRGLPPQQAAAQIIKVRHAPGGGSNAAPPANPPP